MSTNVETAIGKFVWHEHTSNDAESAKSFYTDLFGWEIEIFKPGEADYPMIKSRGRTHGGFSKPEGGAPPHWASYVRVESTDQAVERAKGAGGNAIMEPFDIPEAGRMAVIADPQGAVFCVIQPEGEPEEPPAEGVFVWDELMTTDVEGAKAFYHEVLGWTSRDEDMGGPTYTIWERVGGADTGGLMARPEGVDAPPHWTPYIATDDTDATVGKAEELGAKVLVEPMDVPSNIGRFAVLQDPVGAVFGVFTSARE